MKEQEQAHCANDSHSDHKPRTESPQGAFRTLPKEIQRAVMAEGYVAPTPIQEQCIPHLLEGRDLLGTAQTGTGKTAAFMLPSIDRLREADKQTPFKSCRMLVLAPTRELAGQIAAAVEAASCEGPASTGKLELLSS